MVQSHIGEWAALGTAFCWTITAITFEKASKQVGSLPVNWIRLVLAFILLCAFSWIKYGSPYRAPYESPDESHLSKDVLRHLWLWLSLSGLVGFVFGDLLLFRAFVEIGSRISMLIMALVPALTALISWIWLHENLSQLNIFAMILTVVGIAMVVLEQNQITRHIEFSHPIRGVLLALGGAMGQAVGLAMSKEGMGKINYPFPNSFIFTQIRVLFGILGFSILFFPMRRWFRVKQALKNGRAMALISIGAFFGPFLGVSLSLFAILNTFNGVAATIMAIVPILIIPAAVLFFKEKVTFREIVGAFIAIGGVTLLFFMKEQNSI